MSYTLSCGCEPDSSGFGWCSDCVKKLRSKIWSTMSEERKKYDRTFAPEESMELDNMQCSCHINPPCNFCVDQNPEDV